MQTKSESSNFISTLIIIFVNLIYVQPVPVLVCPASSIQEEMLSVYHHNLFCNKSLNCTNIEIAFPGLALIALHHGEWNEMDPILSHLSSCGVKISVAKISETIPKHICLVDERITIFSFTSFGLDFIQKHIEIKKCTIDYPSGNDELLKRVLSQCPSTYWVFGNRSCNGQLSSSFALKINRLAEDDNLIFKNDIRVGTAQIAPFLIKATNQNGSITYTGLLVEILSKIGLFYNFQFKFIDSIDGQYGAQYNDTAWNGLIGMIQREEVDLVAADLTMTYTRQQVVDFSVPYYYEGYGILMQLSTKNSIEFWTIIYLFTPTDWILVVMSLFFAAFYTHLLHEFDKDGSKSGFKNLSQSFWYIYSGLVNQGGEIIPQTLAARAFLIFWWIYVLLITSIYSGCLIAIVTENHVHLPFKDMSGLVNAIDSGNYKICIVNNTAFKAAIFNQTDRDSIILQNFFKQNPSYLVNTHDGCINKLLTESTVAIVDQLFYLKDIQNDHCLNKTFILLNDYFYNNYFAFAFQKGSALKDLFSKEISKILDTGMIQLWQSQYSARPKLCRIINADDIISIENEPLKIEAIAGALIILSVGVCFSMSYFLGEIYIRRRNVVKHLTIESKINVTDCEK